MNKSTRRNLFKKTAITMGAMTMGSSVVSGAVNACGLTPAQTEGPFYPIRDQSDKDSDLTLIKKNGVKASGEVIIMKGVVVDENCKVVANTVVEIWQACATGKYNHPGDPNPAKLDPNFQYWGRAITNELGEYQFKTIRPGHYQATSTWMRPAHIHLKVHRRGYVELTSQVYFSGDRYNSQDRILQALSKEEQSKLVVDFKQQTDAFGQPIKGPKVGVFDISITSI